LKQKLQRDVNCLGDEDRNTRRRALEKIKRETLPTPPVPKAVINSLADRLLKPLLKVVSDPVERCRNLAIEIMAGHCELVDNVDTFLPYIIPVAVSRLGGVEISEPSEEVRLQLVQFITQVVKRCHGDNLPAYLTDFITILQRTIIDPYPEIKKVLIFCSWMYLIGSCWVLMLNRRAVSCVLLWHLKSLIISICKLKVL
jgi:dynein assembly factor 5